MNKPLSNLPPPLVEALWETALVLASVITGVLLSLGDKQRLESGFGIAVATFAATLLVRIAWRSVAYEEHSRVMKEKFESNSDDMRASISYLKSEVNEMKRTISFISGEQKVRELRYSLMQEDDWVKSAGLAALGDYLSWFGRMPETRGFVVNSESLSLIAYEHFWNTLTEEQIRRGNNKPLIVRVTHSSSEDVWDTDIMQQLLQQQQALFVEKGGCVVRVFLNEKEEVPEKTAKKIAEMRALNINAYYVQTRNITQLESDFLWVEPYVVMWRVGANRTRLQQCEVMHADDKIANDLARQWCAVGRQVVLNYGDQVSPEIKRILTTFRNSELNNTDIDLIVAHQKRGR